MQNQSQCEACQDLRNKINRPGDVVRVFHGGKFEGEAEILNPLDDREVPYPKKLCLVCNENINMIDSRFRVKFISGRNKGWVTARKIEQFHSLGVTPVKNNFDAKEEEEEE